MCIAVKDRAFLPLVLMGRLATSAASCKVHEDFGVKQIRLSMLQLAEYGPRIYWLMCRIKQHKRQDEEGCEY